MIIELMKVEYIFLKHLEEPTGSTGITTFSTFNGRAYYRLSYDTNKIIDDISDRFDGTTDKFNLTTSGVD